MADAETVTRFRKIFSELKEGEHNINLTRDVDVSLCRTLMNSRESIAALIDNNDYIFYFPADEADRPVKED